MAQAEPSQSTGRDTGTNPAEGFGRFKNDLADHLDLHVIRKLSYLLGLNYGEIDIIDRSRTPGYIMVNLMEKRGVIASTCITDLVHMLHDLKLDGLAKRIQESFQANTSQTMKDQYLEGKHFLSLTVDIKALEFAMVQWYDLLTL